MQALSVHGYDVWEGDESATKEFLAQVDETVESLTIYEKRGCDLLPVVNYEKLKELIYIQDPLPNRLPVELQEILTRMPRLQKLELAWAGPEIDNDTLEEIRKINPSLNVRQRTVSQ